MMNTRLKRLENKKKLKPSKELVYLSHIDGAYYEGASSIANPEKLVSEEGVDALFQDDTKLVMIVEYSKGEMKE